MAIQFFEGCGEYYDTSQIGRVWIGAGMTVLPTGGRRSGAGIQFNSTIKAGIALQSDEATVVAGFAAKFSSTGVGKFLSFKYNGGEHVNIRINPQNGLDAHRENVLLGQTANSLITLDEFHYIEVKTFIHDTTGTVEIHLDGAQVLNLTGEDTKNNFFDAFVNFIELSSTSANNVVFDDFYCVDTNGGAPQNDFLGDCQIDAVFPDGAGNVTQFDNTTGSVNHWQNVDENPSNDDTDYNSTPTLNDLNLFTFGNVSAITGGSAMVGVKASALSRRTDAGTVQTEVAARPGVTNYFSTGRPVGTGYAYHTNYWDTNPDGGAWTDSSFNSSEFGVRVVA